MCEFIVNFISTETANEKRWALPSYIETLEAFGKYFSGLMHKKSYLCIYMHQEISLLEVGKIWNPSILRQIGNILNVYFK